MPIFISKYSPDRSLVGNFLFTGTRDKTEEGEATQGRGQSVTPSRTDAAKAPKPGEDRVELSQSSPAEATRPPSRAGQLDSGTAAQPLASGGAQAEVSGARTAEQALTLAVQQENRAASQSATQARVYTLLSRVTFQADTPAATKRVDVDTAIAELNIERENVAALQSAQAQDPSAIAQALDLAAGEAVSQEGVGVGEAGVPSADPRAEDQVPLAAEVPEAEGEAGQAAAQQGAPPIPEPIPREIQEQDLQRDLQTISTGLQADAAIEGRRNVELAARNADRATERNDRREIRQNQSEVTTIQSERRRMMQEVQRADQAIRQLQSRNSRLQSGSNRTSNAGTSLDLLAQ